MEIVFLTQSCPSVPQKSKKKRQEEKEIETLTLTLTLPSSVPNKKSHEKEKVEFTSARPLGFHLPSQFTLLVQSTSRQLRQHGQNGASMNPVLFSILKYEQLPKAAAEVVIQQVLPTSTGNSEKRQYKPPVPAQVRS